MQQMHAAACGTVHTATQMHQERRAMGHACTSACLKPVEKKPNRTTSTPLRRCCIKLHGAVAKGGGVTEACTPLRATVCVVVETRGGGALTRSPELLRSCPASAFSSVVRPLPGGPSSRHMRPCMQRIKEPVAPRHSQQCLPPSAGCRFLPPIADGITAPHPHPARQHGSILCQRMCPASRIRYACPDQSGNITALHQRVPAAAAGCSLA